MGFGEKQSETPESAAGRGSLSLGRVLVLVVGYAILLAAITPSGSWFVVRLVEMGLILLGLGRIVLRLLGPAGSSPDALLLAMPAGLIVLAGVGQLFNNLGSQLAYWLLPVAAALAVPGCVGAWWTVRGRLGNSLAHGWIYVGVIGAIWTLYYLPESQLDAVPTGDGGIKWSYADSFFHQAVTQELANSLMWRELPPRTPGFCRLPLCYQYGSHAVGAQMAYWLRMTVDDAAARGIPWIGLLTLISATISAGRRMAIHSGRQSLAGLLALALVFLLPSLQTIYANNADSSFRHPLIVIPPGWNPIATNMWEGAVGLGRDSTVWACLTAFTVIALLLDEDAKAARRSRAVLALATSSIGLNCVAALCCLGVGACYFLLHAWRRWTTYAVLLLFAAGFILWFRLSGFDFNSGRYMTMKIAEYPTTYARIYGGVRNFSMLAAGGVFLLLGFRSLAILSLAWSPANIKTVLLLYVAVYSGVYITMSLLGYPITYLGMVLSVFAAGPAAEMLAELGTGTARASRLWTDFQRVFRKYAAGAWLLTVAALLPTLLTVLRRWSIHGLPGFSRVLIAGFALASLACGLFSLSGKTSWLPSRKQVLILAGLLSAVCFVGALRGTLTLAADWGQATIVLDAGRTRSLRFVCHELPTNAVLATSHHEVATRELRERSLVYSAVSGRRILLEGWRYMTPQGSPEFSRICEDNAALFSTNDQHKVERIVRKYGITHILLEPEQSLGFPITDAPWLKRVDAPGSLGILAVDLGQERN